MQKELDKAYEAKKYEDAIYKKWESSGAFTPEVPNGAKSEGSKKPFVISMPPPNATGQLHLGHAIMLALQDIMTRYHRMKGDATLWLPGTDHAAIATQNKVEKLLAEKGISRHDLGREKFLSEVKAFVKDSRATIKNQVRKMGSSCDWTREKYTLDDGLSVAVNTIFKMMYDDGLIYRGDRIVNWCPRCHSTLADDEVDHKDQTAKFYTFKYSKDFPISISTTRPETKLGDTAIAVNPTDKRYKKFIGKTFTVDNFVDGRSLEIQVIGDPEVDAKFGTGAVGVTPAHSLVDYEMGQRHKLKLIKVIDEDGMMELKGHEKMTAIKARKIVVNYLDENGLLEKEEEIPNSLSICYRCGTPIEPLTSKQWFIDVNKKVKRLNNKSLKEISLEVVKDGSIEIIPSRFTKIYYHWMENLRDWCISRQIWWGHRIPVWYCAECGEIEVGAEHPTKCKKCGNTKFKQDEDTLDTWFSSGLWTFSTLGWPEKTKDFEFFHPTSVMETGYDILFFWVARMILMTTYATGEIPFKTVYLHGLVRDKNGEKMSKSKPETCIDPLEMIDKYGTDALRLSMVIGGSAGNDIRLYEEKIAGYRNFINKIWNSSRFVLMNLDEPGSKELSIADKWILSRLNKVIKESTSQIEKFNFSEAGTLIYDFFWSDFCDWYLEISKGELKNPETLMFVLETVLKLLHPFTPFVTEVIWGELDKKTLLINEPWPKADKKHEFPKEESEMQRVIDVISEIRKIRAEYKVDAGKKITAIIYTKFHKEFESLSAPIIKLARLEKLAIKPLTEKIKQENSKSLFLPYTEIYLPLAGMLDLDKEKIRIKKEIEKLEKDVTILSTKLSNPGFVNNAPKAVVEKETILLQENEEKLKKLKEEQKALS